MRWEIDFAGQTWRLDLFGNPSHIGCQIRTSPINGFNQRNGLVGSQLGDGEGQSFVVVFPGIAVQGKPVVGAVFRADPVGAVQKGRFAMEIDLMVAAAAGTNSSVVHGFDNFHETEFFNRTFPAERIMI